MQEKSVLTGHLSELKQKIENGLEELKSSKELYEFKSEYLEGKKSKISGLMKEMKNIAPEERANYGKSVNELKEWALGRFQKVEEEMKERELQKKYESEKIDLTLPAEETAIGNLHPVTLIRKQLIDIFAGMGFEVYEGREIETDYYNFTALNTPQDHPARDMQDTFYLSPEFLLLPCHISLLFLSLCIEPHQSNAQIRFLFVRLCDAQFYDLRIIMVCDAVQGIQHNLCDVVTVRLLCRPDLPFQHLCPFLLRDALRCSKYAKILATTYASSENRFCPYFCWKQVLIRFSYSTVFSGVTLLILSLLLLWNVLARALP